MLGHLFCTRQQTTSMYSVLGEQWLLNKINAYLQLVAVVGMCTAMQSALCTCIQLSVHVVYVVEYTCGIICCTLHVCPAALHLKKMT